MRLALLLAMASVAARADHLVLAPGAPWPGNLGMPRATAMGDANAAIASSNDAILVNPAGLLQSKRYHFEIDGIFDATYPGQDLFISVVDSASSPVGTEMLFSRFASGQPGGRGEGWSFGMAYSTVIGQGLFAGGQTKLLHFHGPDGLTVKWAQDAGILSRSGGFSWGAVLQNISLDNIPLFPLTATAGVAWGTDTDWHLAFDYKADLSDTSHVKHKAALGAEVLLDGLALRGGMTWDSTAHLWWASAGVALLTERGGLQLVWRRRVSGPYDQFFEAGITIYLE